jgi:hypothetical protein
MAQFWQRKARFVGSADLITKRRRRAAMPQISGGAGPPSPAARRHSALPPAAALAAELVEALPALAAGWAGRGLPAGACQAAAGFRP